MRFIVRVEFAQTAVESTMRDSEVARYLASLPMERIESYTVTRCRSPELDSGAAVR